MEKRNKDTILLSIIMPFFNRKELVAEMIGSILANDFQDWELLAIDDGSTEETLDYIAHYTEDRRVKIIHRKMMPKGAQTCRNMGLDMAKGKYVVFFDSDDYITPSCLRTRVEAMEQHPKSDFMVFPSGVVTADGTFVPSKKNDIYGYPVYNDDIKAFASRTLPFIVWNNTYRTKSLRDKSLTWDTNLSSLQDADFNLQAIVRGLKYEYCHCPPDYGYRLSYATGSVSRQLFSKIHRENHLYAIKKFFEVIHNNYGRKYDNALYHGVLVIYNQIFLDGIDKPFAKELAKTVSGFSWKHGILLRLQVAATIFLGKLFPAKKARQIPMAVFLLGRIRHDRISLKKISSLIADKS